MHLILLLFLTSEIAAAFFALKGMTKQLAMQFYLKQFEEGPEGPRKPPASMRGCHWGEVTWGSLLPTDPDLPLVSAQEH